MNRPIFRLQNSQILFWILALVLLLGAAALLVPSIIHPGPAPASNAAAAVVVGTPSPMPSPTASPALVSLAPSVKLQTLVPVPTPPAQGQTFTFYADPLKSGWIANGDNQTHFGERDLNVGMYKQQAYESLLYFDLSSLAPGTKILFADLEVPGLDRTNLRGQATWQMQMLPTGLLTDWSQRASSDFGKATPQTPIGAALTSDQLAENQANQFVFTSDQQAALSRVIDSNGAAGFRIDGPRNGADNLFIWDAGSGDASLGASPVLRIVAIPAKFFLVTSTPTPPNVLTAAAQVVQATAFAAQYGTPTPLPRIYATATPVLVTPNPFPAAANPATATALSIYATAVAMTTGTFTPGPPLPTPLPATPSFYQAGQFTPVPITPSAPEISRWDAYKTPFPPDLNLYGDIIFLTDREWISPNANRIPAVYVMRPDGTIIGKLTSYDLWNRAANDGLFSPDGKEHVDVKLDERNLWEIMLVYQDNTVTPLIQEPPRAKGIGAYDPAWSPNGDKIVFTSGRTGTEELYLYDVKTAVTTQLTFTTSPVKDYFPASKRPSWSPDGKTIVYWSDGNVDPPRHHIYMIDVNGGTPRLISQDLDVGQWDPFWVRW